MDPLGITEKPVEIPQVNLEEYVQGLILARKNLELAAEEARRKSVKEQREFLLGILEVADALDRIVNRPIKPGEITPALERLHGNIETTARLLVQKLTQANVTRMDLKNMVLDPNLADIDGYQDNPAVLDETVLRDSTAGYLWNGTVLRRARVIVSRGE